MYMHLVMIHFIFGTNILENKKGDVIYGLNFKSINSNLNGILEAFEGSGYHILCKESEFIAGCQNFDINTYEKSEKDNVYTIEVLLSRKTFESMAILLKSGKNIESLDLKLCDLIHGCEYLFINDVSKIKIYIEYFNFRNFDDTDLLKEVKELKYHKDKKTKFPLYNIVDTWFPDLFIGYVRSQDINIYIEKDITNIGYDNYKNFNYIEITDLTKNFNISSKALIQLTESKWKIIIQMLTQFNVSGLYLSFSKQHFLHKNEIEYLSELKTLEKLNLSYSRRLHKKDLETIFLLSNLTELESVLVVYNKEV